jgi:exosortase family protein XrtF
LIKQYKPALLFLLKYVVVYVVLNSLYALLVSVYNPAPDPVTIAVSNQTAFILEAFYSNVTTEVSGNYPSVPLALGGKQIVDVYEGCNSINVMIVFIAFIVAFKGPLKASLAFLLIGLVIIYLVNLLRVSALFYVAINFPASMYFFHKFVFTGGIYAIVFALWYVWIVKVKQWSLAAQ